MSCPIHVHETHSMSRSVSSSSSSPPPPPAAAADFNPPQQPRRRRPPPEERFRAIFESVPHRFLRQRYREEAESYRYLVDSQEDIRRIRTNEMYQLLGMFAVFQGVVFSAVSQSTVLGCKDVWSPVSLSLTVCVGTVWAVIQKLANIGDLKENVQLNKDRENAVYGKLEELNLKGMDFDFDSEPERSPTAANKQGLRHAFSSYGISLMAMLLIFSVGIVISCIQLLCKRCKCPEAAPAPV